MLLVIQDANMVKEFCMIALVVVSWDVILGVLTFVNKTDRDISE